MAYTVKEKAHAIVAGAIRKGDLVRPENCELCNNKPGKSHNNWPTKAKNQRPLIFAHHWNGHDNPLDIWWICASCNSILRSWHDGSLDKTKARSVVSTRRKDPNYWRNK